MNVYPRLYNIGLLFYMLLIQIALSGTTGKLVGTVTSLDTGDPLIGANVMIEGTPLGAATDSEGNYFILQIPPGTYDVRFSMIGYQTLVKSDVRIRVDLTTTIDGDLSESTVGLEEVVVQAERPMIQTDVTYSQANISSEEVDMLPVEEFEDVLSLQAGVVTTGGEIHVRGGRGGEISYMVDGITVTDPYNSGIAVEIENNSIQELQFISGTFNAEYGQAMSGIVNIITKDGDYSKYSGNISGNVGDYYISQDPLFPKLEENNWNTISDLKANIEGPIIPGKLSFFVSGRQKTNNGYLYGERIFKPNSYAWSDEQNFFYIDSTIGLGNGSYPISDTVYVSEDSSSYLEPNWSSNANEWSPVSYQDSLRKYIDEKRKSGDFDMIPMNWSEQETYQAKLSWRVTPKIKVGYNRMFSNTISQSYSHDYSWNPDGRPYSFNTRIGDIFRADISISQSTFANVMYSNAINHYRTHLSNDPDFYKKIENIAYNDFGYSNVLFGSIDSIMKDTVFYSDSSIHCILDDTLYNSIYNTDPRILDYATGNNFEVGGNYMDIYNRKSNVKTYKGEITSQINSKHQLKAGLEYRETHITYNSLSVLQSSWTDYSPIILSPEDNTIHNSFQSMIDIYQGQFIQVEDTIEYLVLSTCGDDTIFSSSEVKVNEVWDGKYLDGRRPIEFSAYVQDKIESDDLIVNLGVRYDYFDSQFWVLNDPEDPNYMSPLKPINKYIDSDNNGEISEDEMNNQNLRSIASRLDSNAHGNPWYRKADPKTQISPRFALAFPITDKGYLHFSYGHFFQNPSFSYIYDNPEFEVPAASGVNSTMGNADMEPQRTTQYEVGFSQQFGRDIGLEVTGYYKDIRNLNSTEIKNSFIAGDRYGLYVNKDHANSKGITIALSKRSTNNFSGNLDYTYSISEGNASDPTAAFYDEQSDIEPEKMLVPLDWDQRHTINATATYHPTKASGVSLVVNYGSGFPYTTTNSDGQRTSFENNGRKPATYNMDMRGFLNFSLSKSLQLSAHINIYNLFDIRNELTVYGDTGRSSYSLIPTYTPQLSGPMLNTLDEYLIVPSYYSAPRQIKVGISLSIK